MSAEAFITGFERRTLSSASTAKTHVAPGTNYNVFNHDLLNNEVRLYRTASLLALFFLAALLRVRCIPFQLPIPLPTAICTRVEHEPPNLLLKQIYVYATLAIAFERRHINKQHLIRTCSTFLMSAEMTRAENVVQTAANPAVTQPKNVIVRLTQDCCCNLCCPVYWLLPV